jgi:hypothetical protein
MSKSIVDPRGHRQRRLGRTDYIVSKVVNPDAHVEQHAKRKADWRARLPVAYAESAGMTSE